MSEQPRFYELGQFLGAYFHQDWAHIPLHEGWTPENADPDPDAVVRSFIASEPSSFVQAAARDIEELLDMNLKEGELSEIFYHNLGCYYLPTADGISHTDWLRHVHSLLMQGLRPNE